MTRTLLSVALGHETDVVLARQRARQIAALLDFDPQDQTRIATAVSEVARNAFRYADGGKVTFRIEGSTPPQLLVVEVSDRGPGIADLGAVLEGRYRSTTGMGLGLAGTRRLMDRFDVASSSRGTTVTIGKLLPRRASLVDAGKVTAIADAIAGQRPQSAVDEMQAQNQELLRALEELERRQQELVSLNRELEDTNRGVVALYAELDERADHLRRADEVKSKFLSNMSHEFRTPVNSIQALSRMLLERMDGTLTPEQLRQVTFIKSAADALSELVNDLLDLAKAQAGKVVIHPVEFEVTSLFGALRGMLRPLLVSDAVNLVFEEPDGLPHLVTDESKVSQILRNFISNALKFTERGEVRVSARLTDDGEAVAFTVRDTGIGISPEDHERIFQEFAQLDSPVQRRVKGTGLGLPLCRRLAELLGGTVTVDSTPGVGSAFTAVIPLIHSDAVPQRIWEVDPARIPILVVEDRAETVLLYEKYLMAAGFQVLIARTVREAYDAMAAVRPEAVVLDIVLRGDEQAWGFLADVKRNADTRHVPVVVASSIDDERKAIGLGADAYFAKPVDRVGLVRTLRRLLQRIAPRRILLVDDEEISRYVLRQHLTSADQVVLEASTGLDALRLVRDERPDVVCLDLGLPDVDGLDVLRRIKDDAATRAIPVIIVTSRELSDSQRSTLRELGAAVVSKRAIDRDSALAMIADAVGEGA
jgi:signal transduction histidine kinase/DNA-binding response OmpR family regulator